MSYLNFGKRTWEGDNVPYDLYGQSEVVKKVGILNYVAHYNSYGVLPPEVKNNKILKSLGLNAESKPTLTETAEIYDKQYQHFLMDPPLSHLICFLWMKAFCFFEDSLNLFMVAMAFINLLILYKLFLLLFEKNVAIWLSLVWITTPETLKIIHPPLTEPFVIFLLIFAAYMFYLAGKKRRSAFHFLAGFFVGLAMYTKFTAIPIFLMFAVLYMINFMPRTFKPFCLFMSGALSVILIFLFLGYNPIPTIITSGVKNTYYIQKNPLPFVRYISLPLYLGFPTLALIFLAIKEAVNNAGDNIKIFENKENLLYFAIFAIMYIIYSPTSAPNRYCMPYLPLLLVILGRYMSESSRRRCLGWCTCIFIFNAIFLVASELL
jgi:4-amino-4-deoxy-L-arabinose transferase-like glycosyltransferase